MITPQETAEFEKDNLKITLNKLKESISGDRYLGSDRELELINVAINLVEAL